MTWRNTWGRWSDVSTESRAALLLRAGGTHFLKLNKKPFQPCLWETIGDTRWGNGRLCDWARVTHSANGKNHRCANSHLEAGENLPLGHCSSYPWLLPRAFPSTPLTSKVSLAEQPANTHGHSDWQRALGTILWVSDTSATPASTTQWLISHVIGSVTNPPRIQELHEQDWANDSTAMTLQDKDGPFQGEKKNLKNQSSHNMEKFSYHAKIWSDTSCSILFEIYF